MFSSRKVIPACKTETGGKNLLSVDLDDETDVYIMAKSYFDLKEYDR